MSDSERCSKCGKLVVPPAVGHVCDVPTDIWERLQALNDGHDGLELLKGEIVGCYQVPICIRGVNGIDFEPTAPTLGPGETLRYWLCICADRVWYEWELIPADGVRPVSSSS